MNATAPHRLSVPPENTFSPIENIVMTRAEALRAACPHRISHIQIGYQASSSKPDSYTPQYAPCLASDCPKWQDERQSGGAYRCRRADGVTVSECWQSLGVTCEDCPAVYGHCGA